MFISVEEVQQRFRGAQYIASRRIATVVYLAQRMGRPILIEGPAGVGKTELAKALSEATGLRLIRLQCYEGLDEAKALYEWEYAKQLLYTQILKDKIGEKDRGIISNVTRFGFFVELNRHFIEGLVPVRSLADDYYHFSEKSHQLIGRRMKKRYRIGQTVSIIIKGANLQKRWVDLEVVSAS